ncbi:MAG TPA: ElyC/SanA/YdcF family protein [Cyclobacteriaceae bacterium]|nr:ElyC/SanA/YdcF family protein [Cyclobacteriaceae bacterium]
MIRSTAALIFNDVNDLPPNRVALVLGTSPKLMDGSANPFFEQRIAAAADLYQQEKIRHIIVSGDNRTRYYNEPYEMQKALISKGVPRKAITLDYAGLRTLDSVVRSKEIFDQDEIIIITQPFHAYRALFISRSNGLDAVAFSIEEPAISSTLRVRFREYMARSWAVLDVYIFKTSPRYLGDKEPIG